MLLPAAVKTFSVLPCASMNLTFPCPPMNIAKSAFNVHGVDRHDQVEWCGKYKRDKRPNAIVKRAPTWAVSGLEACVTCVSCRHAAITSN